MLLLVLEKLFSLIIKLPDVEKYVISLHPYSVITNKRPVLKMHITSYQMYNFSCRRLTKVVSVLSTNPPCPQLYLYSTGDKVVPHQSIESFMAEQRRIGRTVKSFNFGTSPHVDHFRTFPNIYSQELNYFLKECLAATAKQT